MSIVIEQNEEQVANAFEVNRNVVLRGIRVASASLSSKPLKKGQCMLQTELTFEPSNVSSAPEALILCVNFLFRIVKAEDSNGPELVRIACQLEADYGVRPGCVPTSQQIAAFHSGNTIFNCWPFFREYVQNSTVRMSYPAPAVPLLRLVPQRKFAPSEMDKPKNATTRKQLSEPKTKTGRSKHKSE